MKAALASGRIPVVLLTLAVGACGAGESGSDDGLALRVNDAATAADAGLPAYPGAKPYTEDDQDSSAANIRVSTSLFGLKVVGMNLETPDDPERVAAFYREALSKYGDVLECSAATQEKGKSDSDGDGDELVCDADEPGSHSVVYKVGTEKNQRIVAIKPHRGGARFSLAHVDVRGEAQR